MLAHEDGPPWEEFRKVIDILFALGMNIFFDLMNFFRMKITYFCRYISLCFYQAAELKIPRLADAVSKGTSVAQTPSVEACSKMGEAMQTCGGAMQPACKDGRALI